MLGGIVMRKMVYLAGTLLCLLLLSSCAGVGALVTITAFGVEGYEEARVHRPDLQLKPISNYLPDLNIFSKESSNRENTKTSSSNTPAEFGFDCSALNGEKKQSKCFDDFSKALAKKEDLTLKPKDFPIILAKKEDLTSKPKDVPMQKNEKKGTTLQKITKTLKGIPLNLGKKLSSATETLPDTFLQAWASAWEKKNISSYTSFYSNEYKGTQSHRGAWEASRQQAFKKNKNISIKLSNIKKHQRGKSKVEVNFTQEYKSDGYTDTGIKELLLEKKGKSWKIIKETWMPVNTRVKNTNATDHTRQIKGKLASWLRAWENKDVNTYISFYSDKFKALENNRAKWRNSRLHALKANKNLSIKASNLQIAQNKNIIELNFIQKFNSDKYSDTGIKELLWIKDGGDWKILKETWMSS
jgi:murein L,D-transpeptidase YafK